MSPAVVYANITLTITMLPGYSLTTAIGQASIAIQNWLNSQPLGTTVIPLSRIPQVVYDSVAGVGNVPLSSVLINGQPADLIMNFAQRVRAGAIEVN